MTFSKNLTLLPELLQQKDGTFLSHIPQSELTRDDILHNIEPSDFTVSDPSDFDQIVKRIETYGGCVVKNFFSVELIDKILEELDPWFFRDPTWNGSPFPKETTMVTRTVLRSPTACKEIFMNSLIRKVASEFLCEENFFWIGDKKMRTCQSDIQYNSFITYKVGPGAKNQMFHREDMSHHTVRPNMDTYHHGYDTSVGAAVAFTDTSKESGATRFIPGSHLYGSLVKPNEEDAMYVELEKGDLFFMLSSCYHAASANKVDDFYRIMGFLFYTKSYLRQEENLFFDVTPQELKDKYDWETLKLLGIGLSEPYGGHVDYKDPTIILGKHPSKSHGEAYNYYNKVIYPVIE